MTTFILTLILEAQIVHRDRWTSLVHVGDYKLITRNASEYDDVEHHFGSTVIDTIY